MRAAPEIDGIVEPRFERVRKCFSKNFAARGEGGASVCVWHQGRVVVDLWGGLVEPVGSLAKGACDVVKRSWARDSITVGFSTTKGLVAFCFLVLADRKLIDYERPVADYWPEFAAVGKEGISVRCLLNHRAGLHALDQALCLDDLERSPDRVERILASQEPGWPPGREQGYHGVTYGLFAAELFKRASGESLGQFLAREIAKPLGADVYLGVPTDSPLRSRIVAIHPVTIREQLTRVIPKLFLHRGVEGRVFRQVFLGGDAGRAFANPPELGARGMDNFNASRVQALELPWANALTNARGLCRVYACLANGGELGGTRIVSAEAIEPLRERQSWSEFDRVLRKPVGWSQGFMKEELGMFSPNAGSFGHSGAGGALGWCDPGERLAFGYVMNRMGHHIRSPRARALARAVYECIS